LGARAAWRHVGVDTRRQDDLKETVEHGIENAPTAFLKLFKRENLGKMPVKLA
jgi:NADPH-dependent curcumin reductase CurA